MITLQSVAHDIEYFLSTLVAHNNALEYCNKNHQLVDNLSIDPWQ